MYALGYEIYHEKIKAWLGVVWLSFSDMFLSQFIPQEKSQLSVALLDLPQAFFFLLGIYYFLRSSARKNSFWISSLFFALAFASKFFPGLIVALVGCGIYVWIVKRKEFIGWFISLVLIPVVYLLSYFRYFIYHPSLVSFINYQKYLISWRLGNPVVIGNVFRVLFLGVYKNWWDGHVLTDPDWAWKIQFSFEFTLITLLLNLFEKRDARQLFLAFLSLVFILYVAFDTVGLAKYLLPVYPLMIILSMRTLGRFFDILVRQWKLRKSYQR